jgi:hypothetical protein
VLVVFGLSLIPLWRMKLKRPVRGAVMGE